MLYSFYLNFNSDRPAARVLLGTSIFTIFLLFPKTIWDKRVDEPFVGQ